VCTFVSSRQANSCCILVRHSYGRSIVVRYMGVKLGMGWIGSWAYALVHLAVGWVGWVSYLVRWVGLRR